MTSLEDSALPAPDEDMIVQKPFAPSADRNRAAILQVLTAELDDSDHVLEFGSGTGQHVCHFAESRPQNTWQPSDLAERLPGIRQWISESGCTNILPPMLLDLQSDLPEGLHATACYSANTLHIVSWPLVKRLFTHAATLLPVGGKLCVYGPFRFHGEYTSDGNRLFDQQLRHEDPDSGLRDLDDLDVLATRQGFSDSRVIAMPANNHMLIFGRVSEQA